MIETIRITEDAKDQLITLKRRTGIQNWNILCRWAFCRSLAEDSVPPKQVLHLNSNVEMSWTTFAGSGGMVFWSLLQQWACEHGFVDDDLNDLFVLHLHRGIGYLVGDKSIKSIQDLVAIALH